MDKRLSVLGFGEPILKHKKGYSKMPADRRIKKSYKIHSVETELEKINRQAKEQKLANLLGLKYAG